MSLSKPSRLRSRFSKYEFALRLLLLNVLTGAFLTAPYLLNELSDSSTSAILESSKDYILLHCFFYSDNI
nr:hypothetical protein [Mycoplasmopsis bovis]